MHLYETSIPQSARFAPVTIDDPYGVFADEDQATLQPAQRKSFPQTSKRKDYADGLEAGVGAREWVPPPRPKITVLHALRDDALGNMWARHQIDDACYRGGREYQDVFDRAQIAGVQGAPFVMRVDGGNPVREFLTDDQRRAVEVLLRIDTQIRVRFGVEGVRVIRDVLGRRLTIRGAAAERGDKSRNGRRFLSDLLRACLNELAIFLGFAMRIGA